MILIYFIIAIVILLIFIIYLSCTKHTRISDVENYVTYSRLEKNGRFGNQLFQVAAAMGVATKNYTYYKLPHWSYAKYFVDKLPMDEIKSDDIEQDIPEIHASYEDVYVSEHVVADLNGWRQTEKYFSHIKDKIKNQFQFKSEYLEKVAEAFPILKSGNCISCHVRRGDYVTAFKGQYADLSAEYYQTCVQYVRDKLADQSAAVIIVSDDLQWCKENLKINNVHFSPFTTEIEDFICLRLCTHHVISGSTFSWWAAWLSQINNVKNIIIAPKPWYSPTGINKDKNTDDIYCQNWILANWLTNKIEHDPLHHMDTAYLQSLSTLNYDFTQAVDKDFGLTLIINMDIRTDKWDNAKKVSDALGVNAIRFPAINGSNVPDDKLFDGHIISPSISYAGSKNGVFGCLLSHAVIWSLMIKYTIPVVTVFEDDIGPCKNCQYESISTKTRNGIQLAKSRKQYDPVLKYPKSGFDLLYIGKCHDTCKDYNDTGQKDFYRNKNALCTHAYIITLPAARFLLNQYAFNSPVDLVLANLSNSQLISYTFHPSLLVQNNDFSSDLRERSQQTGNEVECRDD